MSKLNIHNSSIVDSNAQIDPSVKIGPNCIIGKDVVIKANNILHSNVIIEGNTLIDEGNEFFPYCCIGMPPQDTTYKGESTQTLIGQNNIFREFVSIHRATTKQNLKTIIGSNNLLMAYVHFGHDTILGNKCVIANSCQFAGHVEIGDEVNIGGGAMVSQFIRIGRKTYIAGQSAVDRDLPPFTSVMGNRAVVKGLNLIGLKRSGYSRDKINTLLNFYKICSENEFSAKSVWENSDKSLYEDNELMEELIKFIYNSKKGVAAFRK